MKGILINYEYCTGCHACEVACRKERGLTHGEFGIKLLEIGPYKYKTQINSDTPYEWTYAPTLTKACDMCEERVAMGKMPSCEQVCQAWCIYHGEIEQLVKKMDGKTRWALYTASIANEYGGYIDGMREGDTANDYAEIIANNKAGKGSADIDLDPIYFDNSDGSKMEVNCIIRGVSKLESFIEEFASIDLDTAMLQIRDQFLADETASHYVLAAADAKDGAEHTLDFMGIAQNYDNQGTQLGGGKAYLDKGQAIANKSISIQF